MREGTVTTLSTNALDPALIFVEVDIADHSVKLDTSRNIIHAVMAVLVIVEGLRI